MTLHNIHATPLIDDIWIVEHQGTPVATLQKNNDRYLLKTKTTAFEFNQRADIIAQFGDTFFIPAANATITQATYDCYGYPTLYKPHNTVFDIPRKLPMYTKSSHSKSLFCAGHYLLLLNNRWTKTFCPKLITLERYPYYGPYHTEDELKFKTHDVQHKHHSTNPTIKTDSCSRT